mgnify:CR=1 FL=1
MEEWNGMEWYGMVRNGRNAAEGTFDVLGFRRCRAFVRLEGMQGMHGRKEGMEWNGMEWHGRMEAWNGMGGMEWNGRNEWNGIEAWNGMEAWNGRNAAGRDVFDAFARSCALKECKEGKKEGME